MDDDIKALTRLPGVGKKTAERLVIEMRDRFPHWQDSIDVSTDDIGRGAAPPSPKDPLADAEAALVSLATSRRKLPACCPASKKRAARKP